MSLLSAITTPVSAPGILRAGALTARPQDAGGADRCGDRAKQAHRAVVLGVCFRWSACTVTAMVVLLERDRELATVDTLSTCDGGDAVASGPGGVYPR